MQAAKIDAGVPKAAHQQTSINPIDHALSRDAAEDKQAADADQVDTQLATG